MLSTDESLMKVFNFVFLLVFILLATISNSGRTTGVLLNYFFIILTCRILASISLGKSKLLSFILNYD